MFVLALFPVAFIASMTALAIGYAAHTSRKDRERSAVWARWAAARGWGFTASWPQMVNTLTGGPFHQGSDRQADRGFWGAFDRVPVFGFRYRYTYSSGKSSHTYPFLVAGIRFPGAFFPPMMLKYESAMLFGRDNDLQFENQQFNEKWHVKSPSARFAHDVLHPRAMDHLMGPVPPFDQLWFSGDTMLACITGDPDPVRVDAHLRMMTQFAGLLPTHLLREVGAPTFEVDDSGPGVTLSEQQRRMELLALRQVQRPR